MTADVNATDVRPVLWRDRFQSPLLVPLRIDVEQVDLAMLPDDRSQDLVDMNDPAGYSIV